MNDAAIRPMDVLKPYLLLACVAFTVGFVGYWALGRVVAAPAVAAEADWRAPISAPAPDPAHWNFPKHI